MFFRSQRHMERMDVYPYSRPEKGLSFLIVDNNFIKDYKFKTTFFPPKMVSKRFNLELDAYLFFRKINWNFAPELLNYFKTKKGGRLVIENIKGKSVHDCLFDNIKINLDQLINNLNKLEYDLLSLKINCEGINNKDLLILNGSGQLKLVDYEETYIGVPYKQSLFVVLLWDLCGRWNTYYKNSSQKFEYKKKLVKIISVQLFKKKYIYRIIRSSLFVLKDCLRKGKYYL